MKRPMRLIVLVVTVLAVLAGAAALWWRWDTGRQPRVDDVVPAMNAAVADAVVAAGAEAAVTVSPVVRSAQCELGLLRQGGVFTAKADLYTDPGGEDALITGIEQRLPPAYAAVRGTAVAGVRPLQAGTGSVTVAVRRISPGWLAVSVRSRCSLGAGTRPVTAADSAGSVAATGILQRLGTRPARITEQRVRCRTGDIVTVAAVSDPVATEGLVARLDAVVPAGARRFGGGDANRVSYRDGSVSVVVAAADDGAAVTVQHTTSC